MSATTNLKLPAPDLTPLHGYDTEGPITHRWDNIPALIAVQTPTHLKAVTLLHGSKYLDHDQMLVGFYRTKQQVEELMLIGPIFHIGWDNSGYDWKEYYTDDPDGGDFKIDRAHLISLSRDKGDVPPEDLRFNDLKELCDHARERNIRHAYIWYPTPEDPEEDGLWTYLRTTPEHPAPLPMIEELTNAVHELEDILYHSNHTVDDRCFEIPQGHQTGISLEYECDETAPLLFSVDEEGNATATLIEFLGTTCTKIHGRVITHDTSKQREIPLTQEERRALGAIITREYAEILRSEEESHRTREARAPVLKRRSEARTARQQQLKDARKQAGLTQKAMSDQTGLSISKISRAENNGYHTALYQDIRDALHLPHDTFIQMESLP